MVPIAKSSAFRLGVLVFLALAILTAIEFGLAITFNAWQALLLVADIPLRSVSRHRAG